LGSIPVIDLFAGPGGLSEGFSSLTDAQGNASFDVRLSVEKEPIAHRTLELRAFFRSFRSAPDAYYDYLKGNIDRDELLGDQRFANESVAARLEAWCHTLSESSHAIVSSRVKKALNHASTWVLIGGPPCQAYSLVGRSRMRGAAPRRFEKDERHFLYREYLRIIAEHEPPVFVMENVKGLLSSTVGGQRIFEQIIADLSRPTGGQLRYKIMALTSDQPHFVVRSEQFGIPQARHRVILCGVREDKAQTVPSLSLSGIVRIEDAIGDLPRLRSRVSKETDSHDAWLKILEAAASRAAKVAGKALSDVADAMIENARRARRSKEIGSRYVDFVAATRSNKAASATRLTNWYADSRLEGVTGHEARSHMRSDLQRYLFAASYAQVRSQSPKLRHFPTYLLPDHGNARGGDAPFEDRFRVQLYGRPATTVVSHIAKDGHYFIHPDAAQCRSLTVREAARLQTFPDNYHFEGNRTQQFVQVGNAVPPLLAKQIAASIYAALSQNDSGATDALPGEAPLELARI
jgi:DNA (cytosine-5)-methyltransferase 1